MRNSFIAMLAAATLFATFADAENYVCQIRPSARTVGLISDMITVNIDDVTWDAVVSDSIIRSIGKKYVVATVSSFTDKHITVRWVVHGVKDRRNRAYSKINTKLVIWKSRGNKVDVTSDVPYFAEGSIRMNKEMTGSGRCKLQ